MFPFSSIPKHLHPLLALLEFLQVGPKLFEFELYLVNFISGTSASGAGQTGA
jgi:hypothetical protein